jgi:hypothetical protein
MFFMLRVFVFLLVSSTLLIENFQASSPLPEIFYYSELESAFVREHVDGTKRSVLTPYVLPDEDDYITGPGWSSSGEWFAWTSASFGGTSGSQADIYILNARDTDVIVLTVAENEVVVALQWSPVDDLLLVLLGDISDVYTEHFFLYDPSDKAIVISNLDAPLQTDSLTIEWSYDGRYFTVTYPRLSLLVDTRFESEPVKVLEVVTDRGATCGYGLAPHWISDIEIVYGNGPITIENVAQDFRYSIEIPSGKVQGLTWSNDRTLALIYTLSEGVNLLWIYSIETGELQLVDENVAYYGSCSRPDSLAAWNPHGDTAYFVDSDRHLYVLEATGDNVRVPIDNHVEMDVGAELIWRETGLIILANRPELFGKQVYAFDLLTNEVRQIVPETANEVIQSTDMSSYENYLMVGNRLIELSTHQVSNITFEIVPAPYVEFSSHLYTDVDSTNWTFISGAESIVANPIYIIDLSNADARFLTKCPPSSSSCYGFVPNH